MSKLWTIPVDVQYPVNFYSGGDTTRNAFGKHIQEIKRIYGLLNGLDAAKLSASDISSLTSTINSLITRINNLDQKIDDVKNDVEQDIGNIDIDALNDRIDELEQEVEDNKPEELKYRIMEKMFSPVQKVSGESIIQDTWTKGTDSRLSYSAYEEEANYRVFTVPNGVYKLVIDACGGGGGARMVIASGIGRLLHGYNASSIKNFIYNVTPGDKLYIYAGRGGRGCDKGIDESEASGSKNIASDGEDTEVKYGNSSSTAASASQIIHCYGGYSAATSATTKLPITNGAAEGGTRFYQEGPARNAATRLSKFVNDLNLALAGISNESTLVPPYGAGGAFNTSWTRSDNYTGTYGVVVIRYVGIY